MCVCGVCLVTQSCPTLCSPTDCSLPGSSVHGIFPGKNTGVGCHFLPSPGDLPDPGTELLSPGSPALAGRFFATVPPVHTPTLFWDVLLSSPSSSEVVFPLIKGYTSQKWPLQPLVPQASRGMMLECPLAHHLDGGGRMETAAGPGCFLSPH